jgi:hypothetical protein
LVEAPVAERLLQGDLDPGDVIWLTIADDRFCVDFVDGNAAGNSAAE